MNDTATRAIPGLHHVTAISGPPQANLDFHVGPMGQRLVKRTVNFDDPGTYHLYYGNEGAEPGSILTFFPFVDAGPGRAGPGMASAYAYAVTDLDAWMERFASDAIDFEGPWTRHGERGIALRDPDGLRVELIEGGARDGAFHSVTLWLRDVGPSARVLEAMGYGRDAEESEATGGTGGSETRLRMRAGRGERGTVVDLMTSDAASIPRPGAGTIHHVAFRAPSPEDQRAWQASLREAGLDVTPVIDRQYFDAVYFREPGGVLFEIATDPPGFAVDEDEAHLGEALKLPARYEPHRERIERVLPELRVPAHVRPLPRRREDGCDGDERTLRDDGPGGHGAGRRDAPGRPAACHCARNGARGGQDTSPRPTGPPVVSATGTAGRTDAVKTNEPSGTMALPRVAAQCTGGARGDRDAFPRPTGFRS